MSGPENQWPPATVIYEELVKKGYSGSLSLVQKWIKRYKQAHFPKIVIRYETDPGRQAQVDWGNLFPDEGIAVAILDRLLHYSKTIKIQGQSYRLAMKRKMGLFAKT